MSNFLRILSPSLTFVVVCHVILLYCPTFVSGYEQRLVLYKKDGQLLEFTTGVPDTSLYPGWSENIQRLCYRGSWNVFSDANFKTYAKGYSSPTNYCKKLTKFPWKSFRHDGASDTDRDAISLYTGASWSGQEILVEAKNTNSSMGGSTRSRDKIVQPIMSLSWTGGSGWTLFENTGHIYTNKTCCLQKEPRASNWGFGFSPNVTMSYGLATIGSVLKGCNGASDDDDHQLRNCHKPPPKVFSFGDL